MDSDGSNPVNLTNEPAGDFDPDWKALPASPMPTPTPTATPPAAAPGDCTVDGSDANIVDVLRLLRYVGDPAVSLSCGAGDCTGDGGDANIVDVLRLLRHIGDPEVPLSC